MTKSNKNTGNTAKARALAAQLSEAGECNPLKPRLTQRIVCKADGCKTTSTKTTKVPQRRGK
jgi:hypothetical protein